MKRNTKAKIQTIALGVLKIIVAGSLVTFSGLFSQGSSSNKLLRAFGKYTVWEIKRTARRLKLQGMIEYDEEDEHSPIFITEKGFARLIKADLRTVKGKKWDHFWRIISFDIPERKIVRDKFQKLLKSLGFYQIHKSLYAYPYECKEDILRIASQLHICSHLLILTVPNLGHKESCARQHYFHRSKL